MERVSPRHIVSAWSERLSAGADPFLNNPALKAALLDPAREAPGITASVKHIEMLRKNHGSYFDNHDYDWSFSEDAYWFGAEANLQARALQQTACYWDGCREHGIDSLPTDFIVIRKSFASRFDLATPSYNTRGGMHFIVVPGGFHETALFLLTTLVERKSPLLSRDDSWNAVFDLDGFDFEPDAPPAVLIEAIARAIADRAKDWDPNAPDAGDAIAHEVAYFRTDAPRLTERSLPKFVHDAAYALTDYAIAHEIGHRMDGDQAINYLDQPEGYLAQEKQADFNGFQLFAGSWGYRSEILKDAPLEDPGRILFGPLIFFVFSSLRWALVHGVLAKRIKTTADEALAARLQRERQVFAAERQRAWAMIELFKPYAAYIAKRGQRLTTDDAEKLQRIGAATQSASTFIANAIDAIPETDFTEACAVADKLAPTF